MAKFAVIEKLIIVEGRLHVLREVDETCGDILPDLSRTWFPQSRRIGDHGTDGDQ